MVPHMQPHVELLKEVPLFQFLDDTEREQLSAHLDRVQFQAGETLFHYGDPGDALYIITGGRLEVFLLNDTGERIVLEIASRGDIVGELSLLDEGSRTASVHAVEHTEALRLDRQDLQAYLRLHPPAAMDLLAAMGRRHRETVERLRHTASRNVNEEMDDQRSTVQKVADWIAAFSGSIPFLIVHVVVFAVWLLINTVPIPGFQAFDPYPFGFLTLAVSLEAIFLSVFVLLSQNRLAAKERVRADVEYDVNLKAELEIAQLHVKLDRFSADVLRRLAELKVKKD